MVLALISLFWIKHLATIPTPDSNKFCTYKIYKTNLANLCQEHNIPLNHHDARSDAKACAGCFEKFKILKLIKQKLYK
jgi:DNA polymerase-3 subunit epsilon